MQTEKKEPKTVRAAIRAAYLAKLARQAERDKRPIEAG